MERHTEIPDFSGDDFADDKEILQRRAEVAAMQKQTEDAIALLRKELALTDGSHKNLKAFTIFRRVHPRIITTLRSQADDNLLVTIVTYEKGSGSAQGYYVFGYLRLPDKYPCTYIYRETLQEKLAELFKRQEAVLAGNKRFSRRFHLLSEDKARLQHMLQHKKLGDLCVFRNMQLELNDDACMFRNSARYLSEKEAAEFCQLALTLRKALG